MAAQADGKALIGGNFTTVDGVSRGRIARLNADGSLDRSFGDGLSGAGNTVYAVAVQKDGKVLIGGLFGSVNGVVRNGIARLNADGSLDTRFGDGLSGANSYVNCVAVGNDGKVVIGGGFTSVNGVTRNRIAQLNDDGSLDDSFGNGLSGTSGGSSPVVEALAVQSDGKVLIGGWFGSVNGTARNQIARLNTDGSLDTSYGASLSGGYATTIAYALTLQPDGKAIVGGVFGYANGVARNMIARFDTNGVPDTAFASGLSGANNTVWDVCVQNDGKVLVAGWFTTMNGTPRTNIARLNPNGSLDADFGSKVAPNSGVLSVAAQSDGRVLIGGRFTSINTVARACFARLFGDAPPVSLVRVSTANVVLSWPVGWNGFVPEQTANLTGSWTQVAQPPINDGVNWRLNLSATNAQQFFRLQKP